MKDKCVCICTIILKNIHMFIFMKITWAVLHGTRMITKRQKHTSNKTGEKKKMVTELIRKTCILGPPFLF